MAPDCPWLSDLKFAGFAGAGIFGMMAALSAVTSEGAP